MRSCEPIWKPAFYLSVRFGLWFSLGALAVASPNTLYRSLAGRWGFELDRSDEGIGQKWFERSLAEKIALPGSLPAQGVGDDITLETKWTGDIVDKSWFTAPQYAQYRQPGNLKVPFWLQPEKYYAGVAWYQRDLDIPKAWKGKRILLTLERPHWETRVWIDDRDLGSNRSLSTPHEYDLGTALSTGKHRVTIRVDNRMVVDLGANSHCVSDHTQGNWNGIVGEISLRATNPLWVDDLQVYPHLTSKSVTLKGTIGNATGQAGAGSLVARVDEAVERGIIPGPARHEFPVSWRADGGRFEIELPVPNAKPWNEFSPALFHCEVMLAGSDEWTIVPFGFREISAAGSQLLMNGQKMFIRGTLECCIFPLTGHPPTDTASWRRLIETAKAHGLNLIRFHSYCPPAAAFDAADHLGFYFQVETCWANQSTTLGDGKPVDEWVYEETDRILKVYGNHPSFILMPYGNEPGGSKANAYLAKYVEHYKTKDPRRLWTSGSGWPQLAENQVHVTPDPRIQAWGDGLKSRINALPPETRTDYRDYISKRNVPVISHEIGQWCVYPNFDEIGKYKGYLKPKNFEIFRDSLNARHLGKLAHQFLLASGKLQALCYKEDIESALRTPGMGGFELLDLHDFPGQGTALVGVLDPFWDSKGYISPAEFKRFCNSTVPLARLAKRVFTTDEQMEADLEVAHFGPQPLPGMATVWRLEDDDRRVVASGKMPNLDLTIGNGIALGRINVDLKQVPAPSRYKLMVTVGPGSYIAANSSSAPPSFRNDWDIWVYPPTVSVEPPDGVALIHDLDDQAIQDLTSGGKALLLLPPHRVRNDPHAKVALGFSSIFWNTAWTARQPPTTLGILCEPKAPALARFPTDYHSNWQWWYLVSRAGAMILDDLPADLHPIVQVIDDWVTNHKLGLIFEAKIGQGKLLVSSIDLEETGGGPVARQMLHSLLQYMGSPKFMPAVTLTPAQVRGLMTEAGASKSN
ncbi:MAG TPA: sugar-binding domain-containing protein [Verrucomicrobiae bacterium]